MSWGTNDVTPTTSDEASHRLCREADNDVRAPTIGRYMGYVVPTTEIMSWVKKNGHDTVHVVGITWLMSWSLHRLSRG